MADHFIKLCKPLHHNKAVIRRVDGHWPPANPVWRRVILFPQGNHSSLPSPLGTIYLLSRLFTGACWVASVVSGSSWPYGLGPVRFLSPRDSPGINTGVGCHALLQGIFPIQGSSPRLIMSPALQAGSLPQDPPGKPLFGVGEAVLFNWASPVSQMVKNLPAMWETCIWTLGHEDPSRRGWLPTPVFLPGEFHGQRNLASYILCGHKELFN